MKALFQTNGYTKKSIIILCPFYYPKLRFILLRPVLMVLQLQIILCFTRPILFWLYDHVLLGFNITILLRFIPWNSFDFVPRYWLVLLHHTALMLLPWYGMDFIPRSLFYYIDTALVLYPDIAWFYYFNNALALLPGYYLILLPRYYMVLFPRYC